MGAKYSFMHPKKPAMIALIIRLFRLLYIVFSDGIKPWAGKKTN
jgi:hypothetical protein